MSQTSYSSALAVGVPGMPADNGPRDVASRVNPVVAIPFGVAVCRGVDPDRDVKLPTTAAEAAACVGVALRDFATENASSPEYAIGSAVSMMKKGRVIVQVEEAVTPASPVYVRYATGIIDTGLTQKGAFRDTPDGTAQVITLTPAAGENSKTFGVNIFDKDGNLLKSASTASDADMTATEVCDALRTALGTVTGVAFTGTATLIITSSVLGQAFSVSTFGNGAMGVAYTTPNTQSAAQIAGAKYMSSASANGFAIVELDL